MCTPDHETTEAHPVSEIVSDKAGGTRDIDPKLIRDLVLANHILYDQNVVDAFGHVSVRHDKRPDRFFLARSMAPAMVTEADIVEFDLDGNPMNGDKRPVYLERFIHSEIFRARPDVKAVVHSHSYAVIPFGMVATKRLRAVWHMSGFLGTDTPIFEIRDHAGDESDLLIRDNPLGVALAQSLGPRNAVLMRGHGCTVVGETLPEVVYRGVYTDLNAKIQLQTMGLDEDPVYLTAGEAHATMMANRGQLGRAWDMWSRKVQAKGATAS